MVTSLYLRALIYTKMTGILRTICRNKSLLAQVGATSQESSLSAFFMANWGLDGPLLQKRSKQFRFLWLCASKWHFLRSWLIKVDLLAMLKIKILLKNQKSVLINWTGFSHCVVYSKGDLGFAHPLFLSYFIACTPISDRFFQYLKHFDLS